MTIRANFLISRNMMFTGLQTQVMTLNICLIILNMLKVHESLVDTEISDITAYATERNHFSR